MKRHDHSSSVATAARLRVARRTFSQKPEASNEMNANQTKDFDLRQEDSVVYQRSQVGQEREHTRRGNEVQGPIVFSADLRESLGPRSHC
jgi:hypothetical protein